MNLEKATEAAQASGTKAREEIRPRLKRAVRIIYNIPGFLLLLLWIFQYQPWVFGRGELPSSNFLTDNIIWFVFGGIVALIAFALWLAGPEKKGESK